ncbi:efflux RND transporter periplasmic adaptor subunit [Seongchinamella sediminis]|uniref:Efflux RND transporter periplasmic adaptor subunit n=1 Tax=Seongchinamella sediminis TaxID=2283635 RepID=A0A3L7DVE1_9GAMM|nr:efflux RND transporter periplasmic adaptor subunit [Seongchinamella sediminis]RLQ20499.1 efflux RND transporter periplasmic adaptor subunit [Seongchinamella sediminis]
MNRRVRNVLLALAGVCLAATVVAVLLFVRPLTVEVVQPAANIPVQVFGLGTVEARISSSIGFEVGAGLVELHADHGDRLQQGEIIARLQSAEQQARVAKSQAGIINAEAAVKRAQAAVDKAIAVLTQKEQRNKRKQALLANNTVAAEVAEEAQMEAAVAAAELAVARSDREVAQAALADARSQYDYERVLLDQHVLRAPYDAIVVARHKELGSVLSPGEPLFTLVAPETVWTLAYVDEARAGDIRVGQAAQVRLRSQPRRLLQGQVTRIGIESDRVSEERRVYIACDGCPQSFHLGEQAEVFITTAVLDNALLVPEAAVTAFDGAQGLVWTVDDGRLRQQQVVFGKRTLDARLEIVDGLPDGLQVVSEQAPGLREGRRVRVAAKPAP